MGLFDFLGGGSNGPKAPPAPSLDERGQEFQDELFPIISRGLAGQSLTPALNARSLRGILGTLKEGFTSAQGELTSQLNRFIPREDVRVREQAQKDLGRSFANRVQGVKESFARIGEREIPEAQAMAFDALMNEKRIATNITSQFNLSQQRQATSPTFGSELAGGIGSGLGFALGGAGGSLSPQNAAFRRGSSFGLEGFARIFNQAATFFTP